VKGDIRLKTEYKQKIPRIYSKLTWHQSSAGIRPPLGWTNDDWISCESFFRNKAKAGVDCSTPRDVMWSPRRNHAGVYFKGYMWVMGGRAREFVPLSEEQSVGGIIGPRIKDASSAAQQFSTQREMSVYKSDVWRSSDGEKWELITPGCKVPQSSLVAAGTVKAPHSRYPPLLSHSLPPLTRQLCGEEVRPCDGSLRQRCGLLRRGVV
jgi:hypothetical protein